MNCDFEPIADPDAAGRRIHQCKSCGQKTAPTAFGPAQIKAECSAHPSGNVGTELVKVIREWGITLSCKGCKELADKMSRWGVDGCREHRAEIVADITSRAGQVNWLELIRAAGKALFTSYINPLDPIGSLVDEAIRRVEAASCFPLSP